MVTQDVSILTTAKIKSLPMTVVRIGANLNLLEILAERKGAPMSVSELVEETGVDYVLIITSTSAKFGQSNNK